MSLNHSIAIPVDTHVFQIAKASYVPHLSQAKSVTDKVYNEISTHFQVLFGPFAGWAHSVFRLVRQLHLSCHHITNLFPFSLYPIKKKRFYSAPICAI